MNELDMSRPGSELFPEDPSMNQYNSYSDVNDHAVGDPLNSGVKPENFEAADQREVSTKDHNFRALREEAAKLKEEREYWKGQAEAYSRQPVRQPEPQQQVNAYEALDWDDSKDVRKAFESIREENNRLREEMRNAISEVSTKSNYSDFDNMVKQHVPQLTSKNPIFAEMIQKASNPYEAAYLLAELNAKAAQQPMQQPTQAQSNAQRAIANAQKPQTIASVGGHGSLSSADYYASMSDEDFMKMAAKNLANI